MYNLLPSLDPDTWGKRILGYEALERTFTTDFATTRMSYLVKTVKRYTYIYKLNISKKAKRNKMNRKSKKMKIGIICVKEYLLSTEGWAMKHWKMDSPQILQQPDRHI